MGERRQRKGPREGTGEAPAGAQVELVTWQFVRLMVELEEQSGGAGARAAGLLGISGAGAYCQRLMISS